MKWSKDGLKKIQDEWYAILKQHGFKDIEIEKDGIMVINEPCHLLYRNTHGSSLIRQSKEEYFRIIGQFVNDEDTVFKNKIHRYILNRHAEGAKIKTIVEELKDLGTPRNRLAVRFIIRRYEMEWSLVHYTPSQLGRNRNQDG